MTRPCLLNQRVLVREVPVQLGLAGSGSGPDVVMSHDTDRD
jgi:hypothetical protein